MEMLGRLAVGPLTATLLLGGMTAVQADDAVTFHLKAYGKDRPAITFEKDDITLTATAGTFNSKTYEITSPRKKVDLTLNGHDGLGVDNDTSSKWWRRDGIFGGHSIDGKNGNDLITFALSETMRIVSVKFSYWDHDDDFHFWSDEGQGLKLQFDDRDVDGRGYVTYKFKNAYTSNSFAIGADGKNDDFKVKKVTFAHVTPAIPEPATWMMMLAGFAFSGFALKRRRTVQPA